MMMKENAASLMRNDRFEGYLADILRLVAINLGFDYEICLSTDGRLGEQNFDGQWNGIIGELVRGVSVACAKYIVAGTEEYSGFYSRYRLVFTCISCILM